MPFRLSARSALTAIAVCATAATSAFAASPAASPAVVLPAQVLQQPNVSLALANELIHATLSACQAEGRSAVAVVVDRGGNLIALQRGGQRRPAQHRCRGAQSLHRPVHQKPDAPVGHQRARQS